MCNWQRDHHRNGVPGSIQPSKTFSYFCKARGVIPKLAELLSSGHGISILAEAFDDDLCRNYNLLCEFLIEIRELLGQTQLPFVKDIEVT